MKRELLRGMGRIALSGILMLKLIVKFLYNFVCDEA